MKEIIVGSSEEALLERIDTSAPFLLIDDGRLVDALDLPQRVHNGESSLGVVHFDVGKHHLNPVHGINDTRAEEFVAILRYVFPGGPDTLTKEDAYFEILRALHGKPTYLHKLIKKPADSKDTGKVKAYQMMETLMMSPVLREVLCKPTDFSMDGIVLARLDRAKLGRTVAFVVGSLLIANWPHQVVVNDLGFYGRDHHTALILQNRLTARVTALSKVKRLAPDLYDELLAVPDKTAASASYPDAVALADCAGLVPDPTREDNPRNRFIRDAIS